MKIDFMRVEKKNIEQLAMLASDIWHEFFIELLSLEQIDYMVDKFQSAHAIKDQINKQGYIYYFIKEDQRIIGFTAICFEETRMFLSKLYLQQSSRGKGIASLAFDFLEEQARLQHKKYIYLTVNKYNQHTINVYERKGFVKISSKVTDIGQGYVMDDFIMEKVVIEEDLNEYERMVHSLEFNNYDPIIKRKRLANSDVLYDYNLLMPTEISGKILKQILDTCPSNTCILPPFKCHFGRNIILGKNFFCESYGKINDSAKVMIGDNVRLSTNVTLQTSLPVKDPIKRIKGIEQAKPITIGHNVYVGANTIVLPGITIGQNSYIMPNSLVDQDIPENVCAGGNPCVIIEAVDE